MILGMKQGWGLFLHATPILTELIQLSVRPHVKDHIKGDLKPGIDNGGTDPDSLVCVRIGAIA